MLQNAQSYKNNSGDGAGQHSQSSSRRPRGTASSQEELESISQSDIEDVNNHSPGSQEDSHDEAMDVVADDSFDKWFSQEMVSCLLTSQRLN